MTFDAPATQDQPLLKRPSTVQIEQGRHASVPAIELKTEAIPARTSESDKNQYGRSGRN